MTDQTAKRRWVATLASSILPGSGQLYLGDKKIAYWLLAVDAVLIASFAVAMAWFQLDLVKLWVTTDALIIVSLLNVIVLLYRTLATTAAFSDGPAEPVSVPSVLGLTVAVLVIALPHLLVGYLAFVQYDLIESVFPDPEPIAVETTTTTTPTTSFAPSSTSTTAVATTTTVPPTTTTTPPIWDGLERLNVVLLGADAGEGRTGVRTDTTIVLSIDPASGYTVMLSVPRDLSNAPLPPEMGVWGCDCFPDLITHLYDAAERNPEAFPGPGEPPFNAIKGALSEIFGMPMHYYAMVTLDGFVGVVDALGGVTIDVPKTIVDETYPHEDGTTEHVVIEAGEQHLDGHLALAYSRIRRHSDDFARMHRQRCVLGAIVAQTSPLEIVANFGRLAEAVKQHVSTDIPQDRLVDFVDLVPRVSTDRIATLRITRDQYQTGAAPGRVYYDIEQIRSDAQALMADPQSAIDQLGLSPLDATCDQSFD
jgi:LCP family protein required for cell wall assembly